MRITNSGAADREWAITYTAQSGDINNASTNERAITQSK